MLILSPFSFKRIKSSVITVCLLAKGANKPKADFSLIVSFAPTLSLPLQIGQYFESGILFISPGQSATEEREWVAKETIREKSALGLFAPLANKHTVSVSINL